MASFANREQIYSKRVIIFEVSIMGQKKNVRTPITLSVHCILAVFVFVWVIAPLVQFEQSISAEGAKAGWIFDFTEDERSGEKETEKDKTDDEEKTRDLARLENNHVVCYTTSSVVRLKEALDDEPALESLGQPPRS